MKQKIKKVEPEISISFNKEEFEALFYVSQGIKLWIKENENNDDEISTHYKTMAGTIFKKLDALLPQKKGKK